MDKLAFLKKINLFNYLDENQIKIIEPIVKQQIYKDGDIIFEEGDHPDYIYFVQQGKIKIIKKITANEIKVLATLEQGTVLGELAIFDNQTRSASAMAYGENDIIVNYIEKNDLINFNYKHPEIMNVIFQNIIVTLSERLRNVNEQLRENINWGFLTKK